MTTPLIEDLVARGAVLTDGAWGTQLHAHGLSPGQLPDRWNLSHPDRVEAVARSYVAAGSQIILTNTFQANRFALRDPVDDVVAINRAGAEISRRAAGDRVLVFATIGPTNKLLIIGDVHEDEVRDAFSEQAAALAEGGADGIVIETMSDIAEAEIAVEAVRTVGLPVVACMTFDTGKKKDRTMTGVTPSQAAQALAAAGADVIGANCGAGIDAAAPICAALAGATDLPVWMKANAGMPELVADEVVYRTTPEEFAGHVDDLLAAGADFVGGCCGTTPEFIAAVARHLG
ncbi:MAG: homocysteine S-methyltransferase family protein [Acidimicrobiia bacterium]|nr:homocysteine S-methyltransferase family protein [Acidimicrobiia bacterium]